MVELNDPKFLGIGGVLWMFCVVVIWKMLVTGQAFFTTKVKIVMTIALLPMVYGICYIMLRDQ